MQTEHLSVAGMTCGSCVTEVTRAIKAVDCVGDVKVSLSSGDATEQNFIRLSTMPGCRSHVT